MQAASRITVVGAGAIGSALMPLLATHEGVRLFLIDGDVVSSDNRSRQPLYAPSDLGRPKVEAARELFRVRHPQVTVDVHAGFLDTGNAIALLAGSAVVCDCTDDLPARLLIDRSCAALGMPLVSGAVHRQQVQVATLHAGSAGDASAPGLRDLFPGRVAEEQEGCLMQDVPVHVTTLAASIMAAHVDALLRNDRRLAGSLELLDVATGRWMRMAAPPVVADAEVLNTKVQDHGR